MHFVWSEMAREKGGKLGHSEKNKSGEMLQNSILTLFFPRTLKSFFMTTTS